MKKAIFKNKLFYYILIAFIIILIINNFYTILKGQNFYGLITITIEIIVLSLILSKNRYVKIAIFVWTTISIIVGFGFEVIANLMDDFNTDFKAFKLDSYALNLLYLIAGIFIIHYNKETVIISSCDSGLSD